MPFGFGGSGKKPEDEPPPKRVATGRSDEDPEPVPRQKLNKDLQKLVDKQDTLWDQLYEGDWSDSTSTNYRYAAYANRIRTILLSAHRYVAYTSDIGESFRPVAHPVIVRSAYAISWAYLIGDVSHEGYKAYRHNQKVLAPHSDEYRDATKTEQEKARILSEAEGQGGGIVKRGHVPALEDWRTVMVQRALFQGIASMGLPAFTIHSIVKYSGKALKKNANATIRTWGPIGLGLAAVPALPYMFDKPVEEGIEWMFYNSFRALGGEGAVGDHQDLKAKKEL
ncbi:MAG: hypothetical protein Q9227_007443 [Pyrenula ochraceoflavens]